MRELIKGRLWQGMAIEAEELCQNYGNEKAGIHSIISVAWDKKPKLPGQVVHLSLPVSESAPPRRAWFDLVVRCHVDTHSSLVVCNAGANRSRVFAAAILIGAYGMDFSKAVALADPPVGQLMYERLREWAQR